MIALIMNTKSIKQSKFVDIKSNITTYILFRMSQNEKKVKTASSMNPKLLTLWYL